METEAKEIKYTKDEIDQLIKLLPHFNNRVLLGYNKNRWPFIYEDDFHKTINDKLLLLDDSFEKELSYLLHEVTLEDTPLYIGTLYETYAKWRLMIGK